MTVQLPKTIRQWFTPEQACKYLSDAFECEVLESDLNIFIIEHRIGVFYKTFIAKELYFICETDLVFHNAWFSKFNECFSQKNQTSDYIYLTYTLEKGEYEVVLSQFDSLSIESLLKNKKIDKHICIIDGKESNKVADIHYYDPNIKQTIGNLGFLSKDDHGISIKTPHETSYLIRPITIEYLFDNIEFVPQKASKHPAHSIIIKSTIGDFGFPKHELDRFIKAQTQTPETREPKELNPTERQSLHTIIKTLANFIIDPSAKPEKEKSDDERGKPPFKNQSQLIEFLSDKEQGMGEVRGFSKANLEKVFSKSNKSE